MRIVFYRHALLSRGGDKMVLTHAEELAKQGHSVTIQTSTIDTVFKIPDGISIKTNKYSSKMGTLWIALLKKNVSDIVIADIIVLATLLFFRNGKKVVYYAQDYDESYYSKKIQKLFIRMIYFLGLSIFKIRTIAVSNELAGILENRFAMKPEVAVNGVDLHRFYPDPDHFDEEVLNKQRATILVMSRNDYRKGFDIGCKALKVFWETYHMPFNIWTVGDDIYSDLKHLSHRHFGYVEPDTLRKIMSTADVFLYPSRHEGFGLMVLEAFACKCSVVTTTAIHYAIHGKTALKSNVGDYKSLAANLYSILENTEKRTNMVENAFLFAKSNSLRQSSEKFVEILNRYNGK